MRKIYFKIFFYYILALSSGSSFSIMNGATTKKFFCYKFLQNEQAHVKHPAYKCPVYMYAV